MNNNVTIDRHKYVGGSDLPNILSLNLKYGTTVYGFAKIKAGIVDNPFKGNAYTRYGQLMEPLMRDYLNSIKQLNLVEDTIIDEDRHLRGNCDGIDKQVNILAEFKTFGKELDVDYYNSQIQFYMELWNIDMCYLMGYQRPDDFYFGVDYDLESGDEYFNLEFDEKRVVIHEIFRDKSYFEKINISIEKFKVSVQALRENPNMTEEEFNTLFYGVNLIELTNDVTKLEIALDQYKAIEDMHKKLKDELYEVFDKNNIKTFDTGVIKITRVDPTSSESVGVDTKKLQAEQPKIFEKYKTIKTTNKKGYILITKNKEGKK